jgi:hypothetical protein
MADALRDAPAGTHRGAVASTGSSTPDAATLDEGEVGGLVEIECKWALELDVRRAGLASGGSVPLSTASPEPEVDEARWSDEQRVRAGAVAVRNEPYARAARACPHEELDKPLELVCPKQRKVDGQDDQDGEMMRGEERLGLAECGIEAARSLSHGLCTRCLHADEDRGIRAHDEHLVNAYDLARRAQRAVEQGQDQGSSLNGGQHICEPGFRSREGRHRDDDADALMDSPGSSGSSR